MFQSLVGKLETVDEQSDKEGADKFQSLVGKLETSLKEAGFTPKKHVSIPCR